jgi:hypothetical protein
MFAESPKGHTAISGRSGNKVKELSFIGHALMDTGWRRPPDQGRVNVDPRLHCGAGRALQCLSNWGKQIEIGFLAG